jgi:hypothetical protein
MPTTLLGSIGQPTGLNGRGGDTTLQVSVRTTHTMVTVETMSMVFSDYSTSSLERDISLVHT